MGRGASSFSTPMPGMGSSTFTESPLYSLSVCALGVTPKSSDPPEKPAAGRMGQANQDHEDEDGHLDQRRQAEVRAADHGGPGKEVDRVNCEDDVQEGIEEVADVGLSPSFADGVNTTLIGGELHGSGRTGSEYQPDSHRCNEEEPACQNDSGNSQVGGHAGQPNQRTQGRFRRHGNGRPEA